MDIKNKVVFITGGATGIGLATAKKLLEKGAKVAIYSLPARIRARSAIYQKRSAPGKRILMLWGDVRDRVKVRKAMAATVKKFGSLDILINNAGVAKKGNFLKTTEKDWDFIIDVNVKGTLICAQEFAKIKNKKKEKRMVVNIASGAGIYGIKELAVYSATKAAVINIAQALNEELRDLGIRFIAVCPGSTDTRMFRNLFPGEKPYHTPEQVAEVIYKTITGEIKPDDRLIIDVFHHTR